MCMCVYVCMYVYVCMCMCGGGCGGYTCRPSLTPIFDSLQYAKAKEEGLGDLVT